MSSMKCRTVANSLKKKGFKEDRSRRHVVFHFTHQGKEYPIETFMSHGCDEIRDGNIKNMAEQLHLSRGEFEKLIECPLKEEDYVRLMTERNKLV